MTTRLKITIITANYYPEDTAIGLYTTQFANQLTKNGFQVTVLTGFPNYPQWEVYEPYKNLPNYYTETIDDIEIIRYKQYIPSKVTLKGRVLMMLSLFYGTFMNLKNIKKTSLVICIVPFTISIFPAMVLAKLKKAKFWIHVQDFEFDLAMESGIMKKNNVFFKLFKRTLSFFEKKMLNTADVVSSISFSMLEKIQEKSSHTNPFYFPNWVSSSKINPDTSTRHNYIDSKKFTLLYSGNIGEKQDWNLLFELCLKINPKENIEIIIVGDGAFKTELLILLSKFDFVFFRDPVPYNELNNLLCSADIHFLFQKQQVLDTVMPSKILGMFASSKPSIITGNSKSEVSIILNDAMGGYYLNSGNVDILYNAILTLKNNPEISAKMGVNARNYVLSKFSESIILEKFISEIKTLTTTSSPQTNY